MQKTPNLDTLGNLERVKTASWPVERGVLCVGWGVHEHSNFIKERCFTFGQGELDTIPNFGPYVSGWETEGVYLLGTTG